VKAGDYARAVADLDRAVQLAPNDAVVLYNRGLAKRQTGDAAGGDADIARARAMDPNIEQ
jgi:Flp pilus assembly protein TadD